MPGSQSTYSKGFSDFLQEAIGTRKFAIIIVPIGPLETIPFESLIVSKKNPGHPVYLLEKYRLKYVQGATLLSILRKHYTNTGANTAKNFIGFGDPVYSVLRARVPCPVLVPPGDAARRLKRYLNACGAAFATESTEVTEDEIKEILRDRYARAGGIMDRLPHSGTEIQVIAQLFEKESLKTVVLLRDQAKS